MSRKFSEAKKLAKKLLAYLPDDIWYLIKIKGNEYYPVSKEYFELKNGLKRIYYAERDSEIFNSDASVFRVLQDGSKKQGGKVRKSRKFSLQSDVSFVGTPDYQRWVREICGDSTGK